MNKNLIASFIVITLFASSFISCKKDGTTSEMVKKIQYRWEQISTSHATDYLDGRAVTWTVSPAVAGSYFDFGNDGYFSKIYSFGSTKYEYKVDGDKILYLVAGSSRSTTPQYTDTAFIKQVDDHLLVLLSRKYFLSPAYNYIDESIDSLKR